MRFTAGQKVTLVRFLTNASTIVLGGLIVGPFISQQPFRPRIFMVGACLYAGLLWTALRLSEGEKGGT